MPIYYNIASALLEHIVYNLRMCIESIYVHMNAMATLAAVWAPSASPAPKYWPTRMLAAIPVPNGNYNIQVNHPGIQA